MRDGIVEQSNRAKVIYSGKKCMELNTKFLGDGVWNSNESNGWFAMQNTNVNVFRIWLSLTN